jgi:endonuclease YncB( thermonuclease family)
VLATTVIAGMTLAALGWAALTAFAPREFELRVIEPVPANAQPVVVLDVLSGDTVVVAVEKPGPLLPAVGTITVKLLGVDSPNFGIIDECYAVEAEARLSRLLPKDTIAWIETDAKPRDENGRWLSYVWGGDGRFVNYLLAVDGFVRPKPMPPSVSRYAVIEQGALRAASRYGGLWGECRYGG